MDRDAIIARLKENEATLRARGVSHAALFGSRARGDHKQDSDIDIMIDTDPDAVHDIFAYVALKSYIAALFTEPVDVVDRQALKPLLKVPAENEALYAF
jgi:predicted nucleotidyltransferase